MRGDAPVIVAGVEHSSLADVSANISNFNMTIKIFLVQFE